MNADIGSSSWNSPSSCSIMSAADVMGLDIEKIRKMASGTIGAPDPLSILPKLS